MKLIFFLTNIIFINSILLSQGFTEHEFIGILRAPNQGIISYKINFKEIGGGKIKGESYTDLYGENYTQCKIAGSINKNKLSFVELDNISSKSIEDKEVFCYIHVKDIKIKTINKKRIIQGIFNGLYKSGDSCARGNIFLVGSELLQELNINNDSLKRIDSLINLANSTQNIQVLKNNDKLNINWNTNTINIDVWDGSVEDNDIISIYFNDQPIEKNLIIKNNKKTIQIPFKERKGTLKIKALNEGEKGRNTVHFLLTDKHKLNPIISSLKKGEEISIEFTR